MKMLQRLNLKDAKLVGVPLASHFNLRKMDLSKNEKDSFCFRGRKFNVCYGVHEARYTVGSVSRFLANSGKEHWQAVKWILRYLKGISKHRLCFRGDKPFLVGYTNSNMAGDVDTQWSTSVFVVTFASVVVSW